MRLLYWNVDRLSASDAKTRRRFDRVMKVMLSTRPHVVGLTEVNLSGLSRLSAFATQQGYSVIHRKKPRTSRKHAVLLVEGGLLTGADGVLALFDEKGAIASETVHTVVDTPTGAATVAVVYNYSPWPAVLTEIPQFASKHTGGRLIAGGDYNMARMLDSDKKLRHLGTAAFDRINQEFGWTEALPGLNGTEVPTWPIKGSSRPRQLDHVFVSSGAGMDVQSEVLVPQETSDVSPAAPRLSDHAMLQVRVS